MEFSSAAASTVGSGWAALPRCGLTGRLLIMQIEKHNVNVYPMLRILIVLDVWEHACYLDYKNERPRFVDAFWNIVNWDEVNKQLEALIKERGQDIALTLSTAFLRERKTTLDVHRTGAWE